MIIIPIIIIQLRANFIYPIKYNMYNTCSYSTSIVQTGIASQFVFYLYLINIRYALIQIFAHTQSISIKIYNISPVFRGRVNVTLTLSCIRLSEGIKADPSIIEFSTTLLEVYHELNLKFKRTLVDDRTITSQEYKYSTKIMS